MATEYKTADPELAAMGERIRVQREALGMSQEELGFQVGTNKATIHLYETGEREMKWRRLRDIAKCLHTTVEQLMGEDDETEFVQDFDPQLLSACKNASQMDSDSIQKICWMLNTMTAGVSVSDNSMSNHA
ncbi:MAG: helix-turn-helix domain-containing protein [Clostridiaceae bacterium]|nr:helix-turn-helix domain-containing protein [Clostridiaceae bacterium]